MITSKIRFRIRFIIIFVFVFLGIPIIYIYHSRTSVYHYDVKADYNYNFDQSGAVKYELDLYRGKLTLPKTLDRMNSSFFLKVDVSDTFLGTIFQPLVIISSGEKKVIQYFELGAEGIRYINLSNVISSNDSTIQLSSKWIKINDQKVELYQFENVSMNNSRIMIIAPHPDDAEIASYGLYSNHKNTYIITLTAGEAGVNTYDEVYKDSTEQYLQKGKLRTWNSLTIPLLGGIPTENCLNLGFFDGTLQLMYQNKKYTIEGLYTKTKDINTFRKYNFSKYKNLLVGTADWPSLVRNLKILLDTIHPDIIVTPYPVLDINSDHKYATLAILEALKEENKEKGNLFLFTNHYTMSEAFPFGTTGSVTTLPPFFKDSLYFNGIFSNSLSVEKQHEKIFALEAMNDLRPDTEWRYPMGSIKLAGTTLARKILGKDKDYFRRAIRSNELFFVVRIHDIYNQSVFKKLTETAP